jgi:predicted RNA-binding Zn ribbon-like protein
MPLPLLPLNMRKGETPTAATMRLDGGHPALDLVNTVYGQVGQVPEHDVLAVPADLITFAARVGLASEHAPARPEALSAARTLRTALDALLRALLADRPAEPGAASVLEFAARAARASGGLARVGNVLVWQWPDNDPHAPVHRLTQAALDLLGEADAMRRLRTCEGCCWLYLDTSRPGTRRWCSMADCGTEAKKRRYVQRRRARR